MKDLDMEREIEALEKELLSVYRELDGARAVTEILSRYDELKTILANPIAVHLNMLRGEIAKPSLENIEHLYPEIGARIAELTKERDEAWETGYGVSAQLEHAEFHRAAAEARIAELTKERDDARAGLVSLLSYTEYVLGVKVAKTHFAGMDELAKAQESLGAEFEAALKTNKEGLYEP
jgi:uncharacterized coiled-coil DUF342 family protein